MAQVSMCAWGLGRFNVGFRYRFRAFPEIEWLMSLWTTGTPMPLTVGDRQLCSDIQMDHLYALHLDVDINSPTS